MLRAYRGEADLPALCDLFNACGQTQTIANLRGWLAKVDPGQLQVYAQANQLLGFANTLNRYEGQQGLHLWLRFWIHPDHRSSHVGQELLTWGLTLEPNAKIFSPAHAHEIERIRLLEAHDFTLVYSELTMTHALVDCPEPVLPPGFAIRPLLGEIEVPDWVDLNHRAYAEMPFLNPVPQPLRLGRMNWPNYDPHTDLVLVDPEGRLVGFCWCTFWQKEGWIDELGVDPALRGQGLGGALGAAGLQALRHRQVEQAHLMVLSHNQAAQKLYRTLGFVLTASLPCYLHRKRAQ